jgi:hypothetical protein
MKSDPASRIGTCRAVRRTCDSLISASFPVQASRLRAITMTFSAISERTPRGTDPATAAESMPPFCTPCAPIAAPGSRSAPRGRTSSASAPPISASAPPPDVTRIFIPREAYALVRNAFDHGVSSPSTNTCSVP